MHGFMMGEPVQHKVTEDVGEIVGTFHDNVIVLVDGYPSLLFWRANVVSRLMASEDLEFFAGEVARSLGGIMTSVEFCPQTAKLIKCEIMVPGDRPSIGQENYIEALLVRRYHAGTFEYSCSGNMKIVYQFIRIEK